MRHLIKKTIRPFLATLILAAGMMACEQNPGIEQPSSILPDKFGIDIPASFSNNGNISGRISNGRSSSQDVLQGDDIYQHLETFIYVGESAADIVEDIIGGIRQLNINSALTLTYTSDDDGRAKTLVVVEGDIYQGVNYEFSLTITDTDSEGNQDGGYAMQIFWDRSPIKGVALIKPYNLDRLHEADAGEAIFKIEYVSDSDLGYDAHMIVSIVDLTLEEPGVNPYSMRTMQMFVGKSGDLIDVYGNSNHPNAQFFTNDTGFNWAFVASGYESVDLGVAEVGLPPSNLDETSRAVLLETYSIRNVFTDQILTEYPNVDQDLLDLYLMNTGAPGYFTNEGFIAGGTPPSGLWDELVLRINELTPYNPTNITNLQIDFQ
ncbi:MAG: hypothetical protein L3J29_04045 [Cyclobacteriaceae bacterium]|nr:hypothetical protein [Cyclobacteriaceae bacterium]